MATTEPTTEPTPATPEPPVPGVRPAGATPTTALAPRSETELAPSDATKGRTTIAESVVAKVASLAAKEVEGVESLGGMVSGAISGVVGRIRGDEHRTAGVGVEVGERQAAVDLSMTVRYPYPIHQTADAVRDNVIDRIEAITGLEVVEVNIAITDLSFDGTGPGVGTGTRVE